MWPTTSRHERGYGTTWDKTRARIMRRDAGVCQVCGRAAQAVDHIISKAKAKQMRWDDEQTEDDANLQAICHTCHDIKTTKEQGKRIKPTIGADGWPR